LIVPREDLSEILSGELDEAVVIGTPPRVGSVQAIQGAVGKRASCMVKILDTWPLHDGAGHVVRFELAAVEVPGRFLRPHGGYVSDPQAAMHDPASRQARRDRPDDEDTGPHPNLKAVEAEVVDKETLDRFAAEARMIGHQANVQRRLEYEAVPFLDRIEADIQEAEGLGLDVSRDIARLQAGAAALNRRVKRAKHQRRAA
jgi:hypothetical protein